MTIWEQKALRFQVEANIASERANDLRTRAKILMQASSQEREACFATQKIVQKNYLKDKEEAAIYNKEVALAKEKCEPNYYQKTIPSQPVACEPHFKVPAMYKYNLSKAERELKITHFEIITVNSSIAEI